MNKDYLDGFADGIAETATAIFELRPEWEREVLRDFIQFIRNRVITDYNDDDLIDQFYDWEE